MSEVIMRMVYVCRSDPSLRFYNEEDLKTYVSSRKNDRKSVFWDIIYEAVDPTAGRHIQSALKVNFSPQDLFSEDRQRSYSSWEKMGSRSYKRFTGLVDSSELLPNAVGSNNMLIFKNASNSNYTLRARASDLIDSSSTLQVPRLCSVTLVDSTPGIWDVI